VRLLDRYRASKIIDNPLKAWGVIGIPAVTGGMMMGAAAFLFVFGQRAFGIHAHDPIGIRALPVFLGLFLAIAGYFTIWGSYARALRGGFLKTMLKHAQHGRPR